MTLFKPRIGKVIFAQTTGGLSVIIPNKFVKSWVKNWALMNWTTASMILKGNSNITVDPNMYKFPVRGGSPWIKII